MDEIISALGANYAWIEQWRWVLLSASVAALAWLGLRTIRSDRWPARIGWLSLLVVPVGLLLVLRLVVTNLHPVQAPPTHSVRAVTFTSGQNRLSGHLLSPVASGRAPGVVLLVGSDISSYRTNYGRLVNELVTPVFAKLGFSILYFDKQGIGRSTGEWAAASFEDRANDGRAALRFLADQPFVDPSNLFVVAHSQGGWIAQIIGGDDAPPRGTISLAGPTISVEEQIIEDEASGLICDGLSAATARTQATELVATLRRESVGAASGRLRQFGEIIDYRPETALRASRSPTLFLFGEHDRLVPPDTNVAVLSGLQGAGFLPGSEVLTVPAVGHSLRLMSACHRGSQRDLMYAPDVVAAIEAFVARLLRTPGGT